MGVEMRSGLRAIYTIWLREAIAFSREKGRVVGMVGQPLLYLLILGKGITAGMRLNVAGNVDYIQFLYPGVIAMSVLFTSVFSAISIIWDREFGFLKEVLVAPVPRWGVALGKSLGGATVALVQVAIMVLMAPIVGISLSPLLILKLLGLTFLLSLAVTSLGVAVASRMASMQSFQMIMNFLVMPLYFLSGAMFPLTSAPGWLKSLMVVDPLTYGVDAIRSVVFSNTTLGSGPAAAPLLDVARESGLVLWPLGYDIALMILIAAGLSAFAAWSFSRAQEA
jgi:ABC-2 type transport system permease protein